MKNILIMCGGSGPTALLEGLHSTGVMKHAKVQVLINALDNGLSTGQCRQIFGGKLLGPSDVRKNAMTRHRQLHGDTAVYQLLNQRFDASSQEAETFVCDAIYDAGLSFEVESFLHGAANSFFDQPLAKSIDYHDFSMANLIYSGVAGQHGLSLLTASKIIAKEVLNIEEDFVLLNSDESVFINATTVSGKVLTDEVDIDEWDDISDRIDSIFFTDPSGKKIDAPALHPEAEVAIKNADIIIYSSGTQWTSLIPTYATVGFWPAVRDSEAKQFLVMNNRADTDMTGMTSEDIVDVLAWAYLPMKNITTILNADASPDMQIAPVEKGDRYKYPVPNNRFKSVKAVLSTEAEAKRGLHNGHKLVTCIMRLVYEKEIAALADGAALLFDYDDTLVGRNGSFVDASNANKHLVSAVAKKIGKMAIVSGNSIRSIYPFFPGMHAYADNASNEYLAVTSLNSSTFENARYKLKGPVDQKLMFTQEEINTVTSAITDCGIDISKITNKGFAGIGIKPVVADYRKALAKLIQMIIDPTNEKYEVIVCGRTTIDIYKKDVSKMNVVSQFLAEGPVVYVGDEWENGNDADVYKTSIGAGKIDYVNTLSFVKVSDPSDTALFLRTILSFEDHA